MKDTINNYLDKSKDNLYTILSYLEDNIEFTDNNLWLDKDQFLNIVKDVLEVYYNNYYLYDSDDFSLINKYIRINSKINRRLKTILMSIIDYYSKLKPNIFKEKENSILYLTILIYISLKIYESEIYQIDTPKKMEKVINSVIDNFQNIRFKKTKDINKLINDIKNIIIKNNKFNNTINSLNNDLVNNKFIRINTESNLYKNVFEYKIKAIEEYEYYDINIVNKKMDIPNKLYNISYDLLYFTAFKIIKSGIDKTLLFSIKKDYLLNENNLNYILFRNKNVNNRIKFLIDYEEIKDDYDFLNKINDYGLDIYIEINNTFETNNYNMFMNIKNIIVPEDFLNINEKYVEIWKDMEINFIIKNLKVSIDENRLLNGK